MPEKKKELNYEAAMKQLESIVSRMENGEMNVDTMTEELKKAQEIIKSCRDKLTKTEEEIKKIMADWRSKVGGLRW